MPVWPAEQQPVRLDAQRLGPLPQECGHGRAGPLRAARQPTIAWGTRPTIHRTGRTAAPHVETKQSSRQSTSSTR